MTILYDGRIRSRRFTRSDPVGCAIGVPGGIRSSRSSTYSTRAVSERRIVVPEIDVFLNPAVIGQAVFQRHVPKRAVDQIVEAVGIVHLRQMSRDSRVRSLHIGLASA